MNGIIILTLEPGVWCILPDMMFRLSVAATLSALSLGQDLSSDNGFLDANVGIGADSKCFGTAGG